MLIVHPIKGQTRKMMPELIVCLERLPSVIKTENDVYLSEENRPNEDFSLKKHSFTPESTHIKSEVENSIDSQYLISHLEVDIKCEDDLEQSETRIKNHKPRKSRVKIKIHKCPECPYRSKYKSNIKQHSVRHRKTDEIAWLRCSKCPYKTDRKGSLKRHTFVHIETEQFEIFKCAHCVYETPWKDNLKQHLMQHPEVNSFWLHCPEPDCPYKTHNIILLKRHSSVHSNDHFFKCTQCPYQARRRDNLKTHELKHKSTDKWHSCPHCPFKTIRTCSLKEHARTHANPDQLKWYICEQCPFKANRNYTLKRHSLTHNSDQAEWMQCTYCSYKTLHKFNFRKHVMRHRDDDGPGWHKCPECPYKAAYRTSLLRHAKNHNAAEQTDWLKCPECSFRTAQTKHLKAHQKLHTGAALWSGLGVSIKDELEALPSVSCENAPTD